MRVQPGALRVGGPMHHRRRNEEGDAMEENSEQDEQREDEHPESIIVAAGGCPRGENELAADQTWRDQSPVPSEQRSEDGSRDEHRRQVPTLSLVRWGVPRLSRHGRYPEHDTND